MVKIRFFALDICYKVVDNKAVVYLFGKTADGKEICVKDSTFQPYFYVEPKNIRECEKDLKGLEVEKKGYTASVESVERVKKKLLGKDLELLKVYVNIPKSVPEIRNSVKDLKSVNECYEYDIKFIRRYLVDKGITPLTLVEVDGEQSIEKMKCVVVEAKSVKQFSEESLKAPKILSFDIETYNPNGKEINPKENPIVMIAFSGERFNKVITWKRFKTKEKFIEFVDSEVELIERFKEILNEYKPDILAGYYSDGFDLPYIDARAEKYKISLDIGADNSDLKIIKGRQETKSMICGIVHVDILQFIRRTMGRSLEIDSLSLNDVASSLLGEKKEDVEIAKLAEVWDSGTKDLEKFCNYNMKDAKLTLKLTEKLLPNLMELVKIVGLPLFDINRMAFSQLVEMYIIKQMQEYDEIAPNRPYHDQVSERRGNTYEGAFVYEPKPGLYNDVVVFDFRSLYPTLISSQNISPDMINCDCCKDGAEFVPVKKDKIWFCKKKKGFLASIIEELISRRIRIKEMLKGKKKDELVLLNARSEGLKLLANSFYGYLGFFAARWYDIRLAESVTAWGRFYIKKVIDSAKKSGFTVLYSDTDSIFLAMDRKKKKDVNVFLENVNKDLPGIMELEFDGFYPSALFVSLKKTETGAKKKYALLKEDGTIVIKGFETVRRNWSFIAKEVQKKVLEIVLKDNDAEKAMKYVKKVIKDLKDGKIAVEKVAIVTQLTKNIDEYETIGPHVAAAKIMVGKGQDVVPGSLIKYVVKKGEGKIRDKVGLVEDVKEKDIDADYYINNQIIPSIERIIETLGYGEGDLSDEGTQEKLGSFFG